MNKIILDNIVLDFQFAIGLFGLIVGNLTTYKDFPIKGVQARIIGFIFLLPLLSTLPRLGLFHWSDLLPVIISVALALVYLRLATQPANPKTYQFWFASMLPALSRYIEYRTPIPWNSFVDFTGTFSWYGEFSYLPFLVFEILLPITIAFFTALALPVVTNKATAFLYAIPALLFHIHYAVLNWFLPYTWALQNPSGPFGQGTIIPFAIDIIVGLTLFAMIAFVAKIGSNIRLQDSKHRPT